MISDVEKRQSGLMTILVVRLDGITGQLLAVYVGRFHFIRQRALDSDVLEAN